MQSVVKRFLEYVVMDTRSDETSGKTPSSPGQLILADKLQQDLLALGLEDAQVDAHGYVTATLPGNAAGPVIGLIAHMDTSPDFNGNAVSPRIVESYDGGDIALSPEITMSPEAFPELENYIGQDIIVTDGSTLLGADDKAGIAEIMTAMEHLITNPDILHPTVRICFTPDEEIGEGANHFDVEAFGADFAYTVDGGQLGELEYENFNAASAVIRIQGVNIHPGTAKNKMKNAILIGSEIIEMLPPAETPSHTSGYEGFFHVTDFSGQVEAATLKLIIRDHDLQMFELRKATIQRLVRYLNEKYGSGTLTLELKDSYFNMRDRILPVYHIVEVAQEVMESLGITPIIKPIRGGTDGARLSFMGLPTPNLFTGGHNYHGKYEYIPVPSMMKAVETLVGILNRYAEK